MNKDKEKLFKSKGWQSINRMGAFSEMYHIFVQNYQDLINIINDIQNPHIEYNKRADLMLHNINRYIFNFISSAIALRDNANTMIKVYDKTALGNLIKNKIDEVFTNNKEIAFIHKYRNIHTHQRLTIAYLSDDDKILWDTESLLKVSNEWNLLSKEYMKDCGRDVCLEDVFRTYFKTINLFYEWLYPQLLEQHKQDTLETMQLAKELDEPLPKIYFNIQDLINAYRH